MAKTKNAPLQVEEGTRLTLVVKKCTNKTDNTEFLTFKVVDEKGKLLDFYCYDDINITSVDASPFKAYAGRKVKATFKGFKINYNYEFARAIGEGFINDSIITTF